MAKAREWQNHGIGNKANRIISRRGYFQTLMAETITVDGSGRIYLPKIIRRLLRLEPNSIMEVAVMDDQVILRRVDSVVQRGRGMFRHPEPVPVQQAVEAARKRYHLE